MPLVTNPQTEPVKRPNWGDFTIAMFQDRAYQRVSYASADKLAVSRIETFFGVCGRELPVLAQIWARMIEQCAVASRPTAAEAQQWRALATASAMPISFTDSGLLVVEASA